MNKLRFLTATVILLLLLNIGTLVYLFLSRHKEERRLPPGRSASGYIIEQLQLDAQQQQQFSDLRMQHQAIAGAAHREDRRLHDIYFSLLKTDNPDRAKADSVSALIAAQRSLMESATFAHFKELRKLCRDDQKKRFDTIIDEIARRIGPNGPPPGGPPPGMIDN
ncbi:MAG: hypothetical protein WDO16_25130 [Bacteroidota bacterium]